MAQSLASINNTGLLPAASKKRCKPDQLVEDEVNKIVNIRRLTTQYGPCIQVELETCVVYLPKRFTEVINEKKVQELNQQSLGLVMRGTLPTSNGVTARLEFVPV